jgi:hypothetical protein
MYIKDIVYIFQAARKLRGTQNPQVAIAKVQLSYMTVVYHIFSKLSSPFWQKNA